MLEKKYNPGQVEKHWQEHWLEKGIFSFDPSAPGEVYSIDTPPPTLSGALHIGHVYSYTQAEIIARYKRMRGYNVFYPFGFDDNGLPTERLVEKEQGVRGRDMSREDFNLLCMETVQKYHLEFRDLLNSLGFSVDWNLAYSTISPEVQRISQRSFLDLYKKGKVYRKESPALWCPECQTAIAQAELESRDKETTFNYMNFLVGDLPLQIATTRPELLASCVAIMVHPSDERYQELVGQQAQVPLYNYLIPVIADEAVDKDKGTGAVMVCTFGDQQDLFWWRQHQLPLKQILGPDGRVVEDVEHIGGMSIAKARATIIGLLQDNDLLLKQEELKHTTSVHERCGKPVEFYSTHQWFISVLPHRDEILAAGEQVTWYPQFMKRRFRDWVENLQWDWCISRQRYFGVPFPVWYCQDCGSIVLPEDGELPVNPLSTQPSRGCICGGNLEPETDVMDTWATSATTPLINARWGENDDMSDKLLPMSMRTQAHEIIRTWAFYTIAKSIFHRQEIPWQDIMICGFVLAKKGEKISKSKGNATDTPQGLVEHHSADVLRYWAASARLGSDIAFSDRELAAGKKVTVKLWNASKFSLMHLEDYQWQPGQVIEVLDQWMLKRLAELQHTMASQLDKYEVGLARETLERFFWNDFCDNYLELVKDRLYNPDRRGLAQRLSAQSTLYQVLKELLKMFAIFLPHITEEIYIKGMAPKDISLHLTHWGEFEDLPVTEFPGQDFFEILSEIRKGKSTQGLSLATAVKKLTITGADSLLKNIAPAKDDLAAASKAEAIEFDQGDLLSVTMELD